MRKKEKVIKVLHGMSDVAGQGSYSARGLRDIGIDATIAVWRKNPFGYPVDIDLKINKEKLKKPVYAVYSASKMLFFTLFAIFKYNTFHFHFGNSLLPYGLDLFFLKLQRKRIIMEYHGGDIRFFYDKEKPQYYPYETIPVISEKSKRANDRILKYADTVVTHDEELRKHIPHKNLFITPLRVDIRKMIPIYPEVNKHQVTIVHAPSNYVGKGSKYVIESVEQLKQKYEIEFILVENKTQEEAFEYYKKADIIIDQFFAQTYGVFAVEAMALGKPVISYISDEIKETFPIELPIVSATIDTLTEVLEELVINGELRHQLGINGRKYVEDYHDFRKVAQVQKDIYQDIIQPMSTRESFEYTKSKTVPTDIIC